MRTLSFRQTRIKEQGYSSLEFIVVLVIVGVAGIVAILGALSGFMQSKFAAKAQSVSDVVKNSTESFEVSKHAFPNGGSKVKCDDTETQVYNSYFLAYYVDEYQTNHPTEKLPELTVDNGEVSTSKETDFLKGNNFKRFVNQTSCHKVKLEPQDAKNFTISMENSKENSNSHKKNQSSTDTEWVTVYDSSSNSSRKNLETMVDNSKKS